MKLRHIALAVIIAVVWGVNFTIMRYGLDNFSPMLLGALRFLAAGLPALFLTRPNLPWRRMVPTGLCLFFGQFAFLFSAMANGLSPGVASVTMQAQAFITMGIAALVLGERPRARQIAGTLVAFAGIAAIASTAGDLNVTPIGLALSICAATSWASGNVLLRGSGQVDMLALISWLCLLQVPPFVIAALIVDGPSQIATALAGAHWLGWFAVIYLAFLSTTVGYGLWAQLLKLYPAASVAPFSLLVPIFGVSASAILLGEQFGLVRLGGMVLVLVGLAVVVLPVGALLARRNGLGSHS